MGEPVLDAIVVEAQSVARSPSTVNDKMLVKLMDEYPCLRKYNAVVPMSNQRANSPPQGKVALYIHYLSHSNFRFPPTTFYLRVLNYFKLGFAQLHPVAVSKITTFEMLLVAMGIKPSVPLFRACYKLMISHDWFSVELKDRKKKFIRECFTSHRNWRFKYVFVDAAFRNIWASNLFGWRTGFDKSLNNAPALTPQSETLCKQILRKTIVFRVYEEGALVLAGVSDYWIEGMKPVIMDSDTGKPMSLMDFMEGDPAIMEYEIESHPTDVTLGGQETGASSHVNSGIDTTATNEVTSSSTSGAAENEKSLSRTIVESGNEDETGDFDYLGATSIPDPRLDGRDMLGLGKRAVILYVSDYDLPPKVPKLTFPSNLPANATLVNRGGNTGSFGASVTIGSTSSMFGTISAPFGSTTQPPALQRTTLPISTSEGAPSGSMTGIGAADIDMFNSFMEYVRQLVNNEHGELKKSCVELQVQVDNSKDDITSLKKDLALEQTISSRCQEEVRMLEEKISQQAVILTKVETDKQEMSTKLSARDEQLVQKEQHVVEKDVELETMRQAIVQMREERDASLQMRKDLVAALPQLFDLMLKHPDVANVPNDFNRASHMFGRHLASKKVKDALPNISPESLPFLNPATHGNMMRASEKFADRAFPIMTTLVQDLGMSLPAIIALLSAQPQP